MLEIKQLKKIMNENLEKISKKMSYILRHEPGQLVMDTQGYVLVPELLKKLCISQRELDEIVSENDKQRFSISKDGTKIRCNQGHSIKWIKIPMKTYDGTNLKLYHGTSKSNINSIEKKGLLPMNRTYVHLTDNINTAVETGMRYAKRKHDLVVFSVMTDELKEEGITIYVADNGVFQIPDKVPPTLLTIENI